MQLTTVNFIATISAVCALITMLVGWDTFPIATPATESWHMLQYNIHQIVINIWMRRIIYFVTPLKTYSWSTKFEISVHERRFKHDYYLWQLHSPLPSQQSCMVSITTLGSWITLSIYTCTMLKCMCRRTEANMLRVEQLLTAIGVGRYWRWGG